MCACVCARERRCPRANRPGIDRARLSITIVDRVPPNPFFVEDTYRGHSGDMADAEDILDLPKRESAAAGGASTPVAAATKTLAQLQQRDQQRRIVKPPTEKKPSTLKRAACFFSSRRGSALTGRPFPRLRIRGAQRACTASCTTWSVARRRSHRLRPGSRPSQTWGRRPRPSGPSVRAVRGPQGAGRREADAGWCNRLDRGRARKPFKNSARSDGLQLVHWAKVDDTTEGAWAPGLLDAAEGMLP